MRQKLPIGLGLAILAIAVWALIGPFKTWQKVERVSFDPTTAREVLAEAGNEPARPANQTDGTIDEPAPPGNGAASTSTTEPPPSASVSPGEPAPAVAASSEPTAPAQQPASRDPQPPIVGDELELADLDVYLILGSDEKPKPTNVRADAIMLLIVPEDRSVSMLVSIPRLLYVTSPCTGKLRPINVNLEGCGEVSGLDLMGIAVEDYTGLTIDHLVLFDFQGFKTIVNEIGGLEVCVDHAVKTKPDLPVLLEPGCSVLDGPDALQWTRSRRTLERIDGEWHLMENAGDLARTERQREIIRQAIEKAEQFDSRAELSTLVRKLSNSFALDDDLDLAEAIDLAWELRALGQRPMIEFSVAATPTVTPEGKLVLLPDLPFSEHLAALTSSG